MKIPKFVTALFLLACALTARAQTNAGAISTNQATNGIAQAPVKVNPPTNGWKTSVSFGLSLARGNTDTTLASATAFTEKKWLQNDLTFGGDGLYGENKAPGQSQEKENAETLHGFSQFNRSFWGSSWDGFYAYGRVDGFHDGIADIRYRLSIGPGLGYFFVTNKTADFSAEIGPSYIKEQLGGKSESFATLRVMEIFHYRISPHAKAWESVKLLPQVNQLDNYLVIGETGIEAGLTKDNKLSLRSVLQDSYSNIPANNRLRNDLKLITSLVYKF